MSGIMTRQQAAISPFEREVRETQAWFGSPRFAGITRLYTAREVVEQRGTIRNDYAVAARPRRPSTTACASCSRKGRASPRSARTRPDRRW